MSKKPRLKRVYEIPSPGDGQRILIDRLWPRGLTKEKAEVDEWMKELAPSTALRKWFDHDPAKWPEFRRRYKRELAGQEELLEKLVRLASRRRVTLVYGAKDEIHNDAVVLASVLEKRLK
jgi:uncharacterized protein YeaO (DUF488 family)